MALTQTNKKIGALAPRKSEPETKNAKFGAQQKFGEEEKETKIQNKICVIHWCIQKISTGTSNYNRLS